MNTAMDQKATETEGGKRVITNMQEDLQALTLGLIGSDASKSALR